MPAATIPTIFKCPLFQPHSAGVQYHSAASPCDLKPFESIPGPRPLPFIGNIFRYITGSNIFKTYFIRKNINLRL